MRTFVVCLILACGAAGAPRLKDPPPPPPDVSKIVPGVRLFTWGGTEVEVLSLEPDGLCHVLEVRSGIRSDDPETFGLRPYARKELARMREQARQMAWSGFDY